MTSSSACGIDSAQHGAHACDQLARRERLGHVVVGAELEAGNAIDLLVPRGEDDDRQARLLADRAAQVESVRVRQLQIEDRQPHLVLLEREQPVHAA